MTRLLVIALAVGTVAGCTGEPAPPRPWVLWTSKWTAVDFDEPEGDWRQSSGWTPTDAFGGKRPCRAALATQDTTIHAVVGKGRTQYRFICLPDTVDPRK